MTARELARQLELPYTTVAGWLQKGQVPGAVAQMVGTFKVWMIPRSVLKNVDDWRPRPGRPKKAAANGTAKKARKSSKKGST
jgi:hypothetical protein